MLENSMVLPGPRLRYAGTCETCGHEFETVGKIQRDEDGNPDYDFARKACAGKGCITDLCEHCVENGKAFVCDGCGKRFCGEHGHDVCGELYCDSCEVEALRSAFEAEQEKAQALELRVADYAATCAFFADITGDSEKFFAGRFPSANAAGVVSVHALAAPMSSPLIETVRARLLAEAEKAVAA